MANRPMPTPPDPPSITMEEGRRRLAKLQTRGEAILAAPPLDFDEVMIWNVSALNTIKATYGSASGHINTFSSTVTSDRPSAYDQNANSPARVAARWAEMTTRRVKMLGSLIQQIDLELHFDAPSATQNDFWGDLHPSITQVAKARYDAGHFADCVEAALKEINTVIKEHVRRATGQDLDGASLMQHAFSPKAPVITLEDLGTESGRNIQQGYMQIFAGAMIGIRNPKAHANIIIDAQRARHHLHLASLLAFVFAERI